VKGRPFHERVGFAAAGWRAAWRREASFRTQAMLAIAVLAALLVLRPAPIWWAVMALLTSLTLAFELLNGALEAVIDLLHPGLHDEIKAAKDMAAGAVLLLSVAALICGLAMTIDRGPGVLREWGVMR
jgi:diacylglycerol kinase (ATP)